MGAHFRPVEAERTLSDPYFFPIYQEAERLDLPIEEEWLDGADSPFASDLDVLAGLSNSELLEDLGKAVLALPEQYREVVALCDLEEMSYPAAAEVLQCSSGTVASRLHRARAMLKTKLSTRMKSEGCAR